MDENVAHVRELNTAQARRHIPFLFYVFRELQHGVDRLERHATVRAAEKADRANAQINQSFVIRIDSEGAHVSIEDLFPATAAVFGAITSIERHRRKNYFWPRPAASQVFERFAFEEFTDCVHRLALRLHDFKSTV